MICNVFVPVLKIISTLQSNVKNKKSQEATLSLARFENNCNCQSQRPITVLCYPHFLSCQTVKIFFVCKSYIGNNNTLKVGIIGKLDKTNIVLE